MTAEVIFISNAHACIYEGCNCPFWPLRGTFNVTRASHMADTG